MAMASCGTRARPQHRRSSLRAGSAPRCWPRALTTHAAGSPSRRGAPARARRAAATPARFAGRSCGRCGCVRTAPGADTCHAGLRHKVVVSLCQVFRMGGAWRMLLASRVTQLRLAVRRSFALLWSLSVTQDSPLAVIVGVEPACAQLAQRLHSRGPAVPAERLTCCRGLWARGALIMVVSTLISTTSALCVKLIGDRVPLFEIVVRARCPHAGHTQPSCRCTAVRGRSACGHLCADLRSARACGMLTHSQGHGLRSALDTREAHTRLAARSPMGVA